MKRIKEIFDTFLKNDQPRLKGTDDQMKIIINSTLNKESETSESLLNALKDLFPYKIISTRIKVFKLNLEFTPAAMFLLITTSDRPGGWILNLMYVKYIADQLNVKNIDIAFLSVHCYPF